MRYADIIVDISQEKLDKPFQYRIPEELTDKVLIGSQVIAPFGNGNRQITGYVIGISDTPKIDESMIKNLTDLKEGSVLVESKLIELAWFIREKYGATMNQSLKTVIPVKRKIKGKEKKYISLKMSNEEAANKAVAYDSKKTTHLRAELIRHLMSFGTIEVEVVVNMFGISMSIIKGMEKAGDIEIHHEKVYRNPVANLKEDGNKVELNSKQKQVVSEIIKDMKLGIHKPHLIYGITGSGKTEVYMEVIDSVLKSDKEVIVLIPEIALTYQTITRFYKRYGNIVSIINSKMTDGEKYDQFERAKNGEVKIMIGPRSALFTPFRNLGLIVIDEEHDIAYKSDKIPKYHAREVAKKRASQYGADVILGSATPSIETFYKAMQGEYIIHKLDIRAGSASLAKVQVVDLKEELAKGNRSMFSYKLQEMIKDRLEKKQQIMLFINRRGYSSFVSCRKCGKAIRCPHCDVTLTYHKDKNRDKLICHYCGYSIDVPKICPECGSKYIGRFGTGTEKVEEAVQKMFPEARILRMDYDTTRQKDGYKKILEEFSEHKADILVGTQMIVKGHDFHNVSLVGILAADLSFFDTDYLSDEKTFQLLTQAAGRAGRGDIAGDVIIQTYNPEEVSIKNAVNQDYDEFYKQEISYRSIMGYPPVCSLMAILITSKEENEADAMTKDIAGRIENSHVEGLRILGPSKASISKINDVYRNIIYLKHKDEAVMIRVKNAIEKYLEMTDKYKNSSIQFDNDPISSY